MQITIQKIEQRNTKQGKTALRVTDQQGNGYWAFDGKVVNALQEGKAYEAQVGTTTQGSSRIDSAVEIHQTSRDDLISKQVCLKAATEIVAATMTDSSTPDPSQALWIAQNFYDWIKEGKTPGEAREEEPPEEQ